MEVNMEQLKIAKPNAHPARMIFKINDVPLTEVSRTLNLSYSYKNAPDEQAIINDKVQSE
jgi:hypothetical protein